MRVISKQNLCTSKELLQSLSGNGNRLLDVLERSATIMIFNRKSGTTVACGSVGGKEELLGLSFCFPKRLHTTTDIICACNKSLANVDSLLAPPLMPQQQQQHRPQPGSNTTFLIKTWHKAIMKFAMVPNNSGASAVFKLFQARPVLLEKRLKRPAVAAATATATAATVVAVSQQDAPHDDKNDNNRGSGTATTTTIGGQKRRRL